MHPAVGGLSMAEQGRRAECDGNRQKRQSRCEATLALRRTRLGTSSFGSISGSTDEPMYHRAFNRVQRRGGGLDMHFDSTSTCGGISRAVRDRGSTRPQ